MYKVERGISVLIILKSGKQQVVKLTDYDDPPEVLSFAFNSKVTKFVGKRPEGKYVDGTLVLDSKTVNELLPVYYER